MRSSWKVGLGSILALAALIAIAPTLSGQEKQPPTRREFMRQKLDHSKGILEGLTTENYELIRKNAIALRQLSQASEWEVPTIPNAGEYVTFTGEFQRLCEEIRDKARDKNIDGTTLAYLRLTMSCVNCHKYVRFAAK